MTSPAVLVAFEFSGRVRDAFRALGFNAVSCDLIPSERPGPHYTGDVFDILLPPNHWDLLIAHPPCTDLAVSGARHFHGKARGQTISLHLFRLLLDVPVERICVENPVSVVSTHIRKPDQIIQPFLFGHSDKKTTCLWLKNLPPLRPTNVVINHTDTVHKEPPSAERWKNRSRTYHGIANAMASQWGAVLKGEQNGN